jgi:hypothetical protein
MPKVSVAGFGPLLLGLAALACGAGQAPKTDNGATGVVPPSGGEVAVSDPQSNLDRARVALPAGALSQPLTVAILRGPPVLPAGYIALSVPVTFGPEGTPLAAAARFAVPFDARKLPPGAVLGQVDVFRLRRGTREPFAPSFSNLRAREREGVVEFLADELTTYQAAVRSDAGQPFQRRYTFRAMAGISAGANGAAAVGFRNHAMFDVIAPLGGYADWQYMIPYIEKYAMGGFCKSGMACRVGQDYLGAAPATLRYQPTMDYNHWIPNDNGGHFDRSDYLQFFQDFAYGFGNLAYHNPTSTYLPPGVPTSYLSLAPEAACGDTPPVVLSGMCNAEYNPAGTFAAIPVCDGEDGFPPGEFDPTMPHTKPAEVLLAFDVNGNGKRDYAEPVFFNARERFDDVGADGVPDEGETGPLGAYDPVKNPDPAGDNFHWFHNPGGTEKNGWWDAGEPYRDHGLDGVPAGASCAADFGEGNGRYDVSPTVQRFLDHDPRTLLARMTPEERARLRVWIDGGIHDFFGNVVIGEHIAGGLASYGLNVRSYEDFPHLTDDSTQPFDFATADTSKMGRNVMLRFGKPNATLEELDEGDGKHVGTPQQALFRFLALFKFVDSVMPGGDRSPARVGDASAASNRVFFSPAVAVCRQPGSRACYQQSSRRSCADDEDCAESERCLFGTCRNEPAGSRTGCADDGDCRGGEMCLRPLCVQRPPSCRTDADCSGGMRCEDRSCEEDSNCEAGEKCVYGVCRKASGSLNKCARDADCTGGEICLGDRTYLIVLPPGYDDPANANLRYPVVYILHGYGQEPRDLALTVFITANYMAVGVLQKMIFVYPDGKCYLGECERASWYVDQPPGPDGVVRFGFESSVKELIQHVDRAYRTKPEAVLEDRR